MRTRITIGLACIGLLSGPAAAEVAGDTAASVHEISTEGVGEAIGTIRFEDSAHGLLIIPEIDDIGEPGAYGMHIHQNPDCGVRDTDGSSDMATPGSAAGGHYDPDDRARHAGPYGSGHLGDLPNLTVEAGGAARIPVLAPRLSVADIENRAVMIHASPDRYGDAQVQAQVQGDTEHGHAHGHHKGGARMFCGVIESSGDG